MSEPMNIAAGWKSYMDIADFDEQEIAIMQSTFYAGASAVLIAYHNIYEAHEQSEAAHILVKAIHREVVDFAKKMEEDVQ